MWKREFHYFVIAFSVCLLCRALFYFHTLSVCSIIFDICMSISLLCDSVPHVVSIPIRYYYYIKKTEQSSFFMALAMFGFILVGTFAGW